MKPDSDHQDGFFYLSITPMLDPYLIFPFYSRPLFRREANNLISYILKTLVQFS